MAKRIAISEMIVADVFRLDDNQRIVSAEKVARRNQQTDEVEWFWNVTIITESKA